MDAKLLDKLRKVLAMTTSPVEAEAQTAAALLQKMLTQHNLSMADLEKRGASKPTVQEQGHDLGKAAFAWKLNLAEQIAEHFYCVPLVDRRSKTVRFIGRPDNVESLLMLYAWLIEQIRQISATERKAHQARTGEHVDPLRWQVNFGLGVVSRLGGRLAEMKERQNEEVARNDMGDVVALTVHHATEISDYLEKTKGYRVDGQDTQQTREWRAKQAAWEELLKRDPEAAYNIRPYMRPDTEAEKAERAARDAVRAKEEARREARRARYVPKERYRETSPEQERKEQQGYDAQSAGRKAADKVNLQPFLKGTVDDKEKLS